MTDQHPPITSEYISHIYDENDRVSKFITKAAVQWLDRTGMLEKGWMSKYQFKGVWLRKWLANGRPPGIEIDIINYETGGHESVSMPASFMLGDDTEKAILVAAAREALKVLYG